VYVALKLLSRHQNDSRLVAGKVANLAVISSLSLGVCKCNPRDNKVDSYNKFL
jgi:hypothetical protein